MGKFMRIITATKDGVILEGRARKPPAPRSKATWLGKCAVAAIQLQGRRYAVKIDGVWEVRGISQPTIIKSFPNEDAAAMWLRSFPGFGP